LRVGIAAQLVVPFVTISSVIVALLGIGLLSTVQNILSASLDEKSRCLVRTTATELRGPLLLGEDMHARGILAMAIKSDPDLSYVIVAGNDGSPLSSNITPGAHPLKFDPAIEKSMGSLDVYRRPGLDGRDFELIAPIEVSGERAGYLSMGFTSARIDQQLLGTQWWILCFGFASLVVGSAAYVGLISRSILKPIKTMVSTSARIAGGDSGEIVQCKREDEIGDLLNTMNQMVVYLRDMSDTANAIASGDLTVHVEPRSQEDRFGNAFKKMVASLNKSTNELLSREAEARKLAAIVQYSHDAIISVQLNGTVVSWNAGAEALLGYDAQDIIGKPLDVLFEDEGMRNQLRPLLGAQSASSSLNIETNLVRRDGSCVEVSMTVSPVMGTDSANTSYSVIARDVTHKRLVERRLREFYSMISHELRTPLTSIRGGLALMSQGVVPPDSEDGMKLIQLAQSSCIRLIRLINQILDMRKIEDGNIQLDLQPISVRELIRRSVEEMGAFAYERNINLKMGVIDESNIVVDIDRIIQVLTNLISNAVKYSEDGQQVEISVTKTNAGTMRFGIADHGGGIDTSNQSKLFRQFQQVDSSDSRSKEGSGLGLFISKAIVEHHGGTIGLESQVGIGSTFWFEIPSQGIPPDKSHPSMDGAACNV
jgi:PAS domain S-box-containing protein